jgi:FlaA1/EpsC-like NDP-sugar epimerase
VDILKLIGRSKSLFAEDIQKNDILLNDIISTSSFLVVGGAGSIGQAVTCEIFKRNPAKLHVVDISENNLAELVRDVRSKYGYIDGDFQTFAIDVDSIEYESFINSDGKYDFVLNLSALKHVRSEKDPFTLMRMIDVNIFNTEKTILHAIEKGTKKYFCVSTDKAANPANMMGASKRIMEMYLMKLSTQIPISTARFANVAFSDGSLLHSFNQRILKRQPIVAPNDVKRYFVTPEESGQLCLMACIFGDNRDVFFPKLDESEHMITFSDIAVRYLDSLGYKPFLCNSEQEARNNMTEMPEKGYWPCYFSESNTTGEKDYEEFFTENEVLDTNRFTDIGIIKNNQEIYDDKIQLFSAEIQKMKNRKSWTREELIDLFFEMIPNFEYIRKDKFLDSKM